MGKTHMQQLISQFYTMGHKKGANFFLSANMSKTKKLTSGQNNLTTGHIAAVHGWFNGICQVVPVCTPT